MGCKKLNTDFFNFLEVIHQKNATAFKKNRSNGDHLGNIRLSYTDINQNNATPVSLTIKEENNYYPFGLKHKGYNSNVNGVADKYHTYNGKEWNESLGLNIYEMDVRSYDPALARFTSIDPVTHLSNSTYNAFDNNPVLIADPSGADGSLTNNRNSDPDYGAKIIFGGINKTTLTSKKTGETIDINSDSSGMVLGADNAGKGPNDWLPVVDNNTGKVSYIKEKGDSPFTFINQYGDNALLDDNLRISKDGSLITSNTLYKLNVDNSTDGQRIFQTLAGITKYDEFNPDDIFINNRSEKTALTYYNVSIVEQNANIRINGVSFFIGMNFTLNGSKNKISSFGNVIYNESNNQFNANFSYNPKGTLPAILFRFYGDGALKSLNKFTGNKFYWNGSSKEDTTGKLLKY